jgi:catalase (peroxidase I)
MISSIASYICSEGGGSYPGTGKSCVNTNQASLGAITGGVLRLSFHDAVTFQPTDGSGGPDGCINFNAFDNSGLNAIWNSKIQSQTPLPLSQVYKNNFASIISMADFWVLAANVAVMLTQGPDISQRTGSTCTCVGSACLNSGANTDSPCIAVRYGRQDNQLAVCSAADVGRFPDSQKDQVHTIAVFQTRLKFTNQEIVALMGAHTIGSATLNEAHVGFTNAQAAQQNTGNPGVWDRNPAVFDTVYYQTITSVRWNRITQNTLSDGTTRFNPTTFQWAGPGATIMLNTDLSLVWDLRISSTNALQTVCGANSLGGGNTALFGQCQQNTAFYPFVQQFANQQTGTRAFHSAWVSAWAKMQELGYGTANKPLLNYV